MKKILTVILFILPFALMSYANGPVDPALADGDGIYEYGKPHNNPWGLDDVIWYQTAPSMEPFRRAASGVLGNYFYTFGHNEFPWQWRSI